MLFQSLPFLLFFAVVLVGYGVVLRGWPARKGFLLAASWGFYASWSASFLPLLVATTWIDWRFALAIHRLRSEAADTGCPGPARRARRLLWTSVAMNLGVLGWFKYGRFLSTSLAPTLPVDAFPSWLPVIAPLGISFYTFHSISYVIDTHRGLRPPTRSFLDFALYVAFFPQLVAGPISRWGFFGPQLVRPPRVGLAAVDGALLAIAIGLTKKVVFADTLGGFVDPVYQAPWHAGRVDLWIALYAYSFQIYFDFSGYTDIATGVAALLGFRLPINFDHPYIAASPAEFWRRWHISLSTWLRDYLYVPLGGNRRGRARTYANLVLTMLLGGLWHGAAWNFVVWGGLHGVWLALHRRLGESGRPARSPLWLRRLVTFHLVTLAWVPFRAGSLDTVRELVGCAVGHRTILGPFPVGAAVLLALAFASQLLATRIDLPRVWPRVPRPLQGVVYALVVALVALLGAQSGRFLYFEF